MIGVDVGARKLHISTGSETTSIPIDQAEAYFNRPPTTVVIEPTGAYGIAVAEIAYRAGHHVLLLTDTDTWAYRRLLRQDRKTDKLDAKMLQKLAELAAQAPQLLEHVLTPYEALRPLLAARRAAYTARKLTTVAAALTNRLHQHPDPQLNALVKQLRDLAETYKQQTIQLTPPHVITILTTIPGVTPMLAALLWTYLGNTSRFKTADQAVSYVGLAPRHLPTSGTTTSRPRKRRTAQLLAPYLHMYAMRVAAKPTAYGRFGKTYTRLKPKGGRIAMAAVKRKLIRVAFTLLRTGQLYREEEP